MQILKNTKQWEELYPESQFSLMIKVDFAVGLEENLNKRIAALEETIAVILPIIKPSCCWVKLFMHLDFT